MCESIKEEFNEKENILIINEKVIAKRLTKIKITKISKKFNIDYEEKEEIPNYINEAFINFTLKDLLDEESLSAEEECNNNTTTKVNNYKLDLDLYNDKSLFKYIKQSYLIYSKNSCWLDCFIILYILIFRNIIHNLIEAEELDNNKILKLNEFINFIIQIDNNKPNNIFELYSLYINDNENENFIKIDKNSIDIFNPIDKPYLIFENTDIFCIKSNINIVCNGKFNNY